MNRPFLIVLVFAAWIFLLTAEGFSQDNDNIWTVETEGTGLITNDDLASARNNAINDALRNAVEQAVATLIPLQTLDKRSLRRSETGYMQRVTNISTITKLAARDKSKRSMRLMSDQRYL